MRVSAIMTAVAMLGFIDGVLADDWPQWLGPDRQGVWHEGGIVERFPEEGLRVKWRVPIGLGYAGPAVAGGKVYVMDYAYRGGQITNSPGQRDKLEGNERLLCFSAETGELLWKKEYDRPYNISYPRGPRCTPTVAGGKVYALGAEGNLLCLDAENGDEIWKKDLKADYQLDEAPMWGYATHPLVDGDTLFCVVGGEGSVAVAFDRNTGKERWRSLSGGDIGYCPPTMIEHAGRKQLVIWHSATINGLDPGSGDVLWSVPLKPGFGMAISTPRQAGAYLYASGAGNIAALLKLGEGAPTADVVWRGAAKTAVYCTLSTPTLDHGTIYGCDGGTGSLIAARMEDGERLWETAQPTTGDRGARNATVFLVKHEDRFFLFNDSGDLILATLSPDGYEEISRFHVLDPTNSAMGRDVVWSHPAFAEKCVFARNDEELVCVSLAAGQ